MPRAAAKTETASKAIWYRLHEIGNEFTGLLLSDPERREATDMDGNKKTYSDGNPIFEYVYTLLNVSDPKHSENCHWCSVRTSEDDYEKDSGLRKFAAKQAQHKLIQEAIRAEKNAAGQNELYGPLTLKFTSKKKPEPPAKYATNIFTASYAIPTDAQVAQVDAFLGASAPTSVETDDNSSGMSMDDLMNFTG